MEDDENSDKEGNALLQISNINSFIYPVCIICLEDIIKNNNQIQLTDCSCKVPFHNECLEKWFDRSPTCPICRKEIKEKLTCKCILKKIYKYRYYIYTPIGLLLATAISIIIIEA